MPITYLQAFEILHTVAQEFSHSIAHHEEKVSLSAGVGRIAARQIRSPCSMPAFDTSAMDGYALDSSLTACASIETPVLFQIVSTSAAGGQPTNLHNLKGSTLPCCSEIMTGAQFPYDDDGKQLDACLPVELAQVVNVKGESTPCLQITSPIRRNQHRRFAGSDFALNHVILEHGELIAVQHTMILSTLGINEVAVVPRIKAAICSTGSEVVPFDSKECSFHHIRDSNAPYIQQVLQESGVLVTQFNPVPDETPALESMLRDFLCDENDILITTGGVSAGRFDLIRESIESLGATVHFHKVAIRPGHPILFGTFNHSQNVQPLEGNTGSHKKKAFFGLPGNPIAAAACLQFFAIPFLNHLRGKDYPQPIHARVKNIKQDIPTCNGTIRTLPKRAIDVFRHGVLKFGRNGFEVTTNQDQASYKVSPIAQSNCWVWFPYHRTEGSREDVLPCFPFSALNTSFNQSPTPRLDAGLSAPDDKIHTRPLTNGSTNRQLKVLILAGGLSTRMKTPKHLIRLPNEQLSYEALLDQVQKAIPSLDTKNIYISLRNDEQVSELKQTHFIQNYNIVPCSTITDDIVSKALSLDHDVGPASGLLSAYFTDQVTDWLVIACDFPLLDSICLAQLLREHYATAGESSTEIPFVTCFVNKDGFHEPLLAVWAAAGLELLKQNVMGGVHGPSRTIRDLAKLGKVKVVMPREERWLSNANTPAELETCLAIRGAG